MKGTLFLSIVLVIILSFSVYAQNSSKFQLYTESKSENLTLYNKTITHTFAAQIVPKNLTENDAVMGNPNAPVTIVEFGGFQEPFSRVFWNNTFPKIKSQYIDSGKVKFVFRDYPLVDWFPLDGYAAVAAECVHELGGDSAYFKMWNALYSNPNFDENLIDQLALNLGYNITDCLNSGNALDEVVLDLTDAIRLGVDGSPSFFINGQLLAGAWPYDTFKQIIDQELNKTIVCFTNTVCDDNNPYTFDSCVNPGQLNAVCNHQTIQCLTNSDCGENATIGYSCNIQGNACVSTLSYSCNNAGTTQSFCSSATDNECNVCQYGCSLGLCKSKPLSFLNIVSPNERGVYNYTKMFLTITLANKSDLFISDLVFNNVRKWSDFVENNSFSRVKFNLLTKNSNFYNQTKTFSEGYHFLSIKDAKNTVNDSISFIVDTKAPLASIKTDSQMTNGSDFYTTIDELALKDGFFVVNGDEIREIHGECNVTNAGKEECHLSLNLSAYNNQLITYSLHLEDTSGHKSKTKDAKVKVDTTLPEISKFNYTLSKGFVTFSINISETNLQAVNYMDSSDAKPKWSVLCSSLKYGNCVAKKSFKAGNHNVSIQVKDKAGNSVQRQVGFVL